VYYDILVKLIVSSNGRLIIPEEVTGLLRVVQRNTGRLQSLTDDLLDQQRIEAGTLAINKERASIGEVIMEVVEEYEHVLGEKDQQMKLIIPDTMDPLCFDTDRVSQVLLNLLSNASKYSREGSSITLHVSEEKDFITVCVADEGLGLSEEDIGMLFSLLAELTSQSIVRLAEQALV
jgi:signal transduction histidine kinase